MVSNPHSSEAINVTVDSEVESDYTAITALYDGEGRLQSICDIHDGDAVAKAWGCDLTYDYVKINGDYRS